MADDPAELLRRQSLRVTPQRRAILSAFTGGAAEHLSADEVHARALRSVPELGRGTVYSTLAELTELGLLAAFGSPEPVRYETNVGGHSHFRCALCLRLFDVEFGPPSARSLEGEGFVVESVSVLAEGVCAECEDYERGLEDGVGAVRSRRQVSDAVLGGLACSHFESPVGPLALAASEDGIVRIAFDGHSDFDPFLERARSRRGPKAARERLAHAADAIEGFLAGSHNPSEDALDAGASKLIDPAILVMTRLVGYGQTLSYDRLAGNLSAYGRGYAMGTNPMPILFPCHRISRGVEVPQTYIGGEGRRQQLLDLEAGELDRAA
jgi:Fe2+ or Zn2+ uptake regulation protein/O6-methylguanine-DNA--protein-cysteine methyltransferase